MKSVIEDLYKKSAAIHDKYKDPELDELLLGLVQRFQDADAMYHHFGYLLMHIKATVAYPVRPAHLQGAIDRAERFLENYAKQGQ
ncbi:MAG: hypothetical protein SFV21_08320 [Rhodospirillaceae bacterium]|nr:hypothetical protein [Rhodospirillaceae bacterium]